MEGSLLWLYDLEQADSYTAIALHFAKGDFSGVCVRCGSPDVESAKAKFEDYGSLGWKDPPEGLTVKNLGAWVWRRRLNLIVIHGRLTVIAVAEFSLRTESQSG